MTKSLCRGFAGLLLAISFFTIPTQASAGEENKSWSGMWNNRKFGTKGSIKCTVTSKEGSTWKATFDGIALGKPYSYKVTLTATKRGSQTVLKGTHSIKRDNYQWAAVINGKSFKGQYRSSSGNNGNFVMEEK